jgi:type IX secretion system PorP/SprF family membrane protein
MKILHLKHFISIVLWVCFFPTEAQDIYPSQFSSSKLALNPAFAGTSEAWQANFLYRVQYPRSTGSQTTNFFSFDYNFPSQRNSLGLTIQSDRLAVGGGGSFRNLQANALYAYLLPAGEYWRVKMAISAGYGSKNLHYFNLIYGDQLDGYGFTGAATQDNLPVFQNIEYLDISSGFLAYNDYAWIGFAAHHLNTPSQDFLGSSFRIPMRLSGHLGIKIPLNESEKQFISPSAVFRTQAGVHLLDAGVFFETDIFQIGTLYRNVPIQTSSTSVIHLQTGIKHEGFRLVYSYGMVLGGLSNLGGGHEIGISFAPQRDVDEKKWRYTKLSLF